MRKKFETKSCEVVASVKEWLVEVALPSVPTPRLKLVENRLVLEAVVLKWFVEVALPIVTKPRLAFVLKRFVLDAVVEKILVVVAAVVVERVILSKICAPVHVGEKVWSTVKVLAVPPLYAVPESPVPAVKSARFEPSEMPEIVEFARSVLATEAQVAAPRAESERTNWLVQDVPAYSAVRPLASVWMRAEVRVENFGAKVKVEEAVERKPLSRPSVVVVETPHDWMSNGKAEPPEGHTVWQSPARQISSTIRPFQALSEGVVVPR